MTYPILYEANETDFFSLGLGPIKTATEAFVTEERNGTFIFEGKVLVDDEIYSLLQENRIIKADVSPTLTDQRFRIKRIVPNHDGQAEIYAEHVSYLSQELPMKPEVSISGNASAALNAWKSAILDDNPFIVDSDIGTINKTNWRIDKVENPRQALGGVEGSILDVWGGEYRFDNYHISLLKKRGTTANTILAYGRNITDFEQERNIMTTYTTLYPFAIYTDDKEEEQIVTIDGYVVDCENIADYPNRNVLPVDFSNEFEHDEVPTKAKLKQLAQDYIKNNDIGIPKTSIKVSFLDLAQTADYADIATLETVELCDDVRVHYEKLGVDTIAKVIRTKWNVLRGAYEEIEIGEKRTTLSSIINDTQTSIKEIENQTGSAIIAANGKNMIFHGLFGENGEGEPTAVRVGDMWYKPNGEDTEFYIWDGTVWAFIMSTAKFDEIDKKVEELEAATEKAVENANTAVDKANEAVAKVDSLDKAVNTALEQSANALDQAQQAIKDANDLLTTVTEVQGTVTNISTVVDEINNQLAVKVSQTDFDKLKGTVETQAVQISANTNEIALKASQSSVNAITGNVESIQSELKTQAGSITAINTKVEGNTTKIGSLESSYSGLSSTIANVKNDFDNLQVGGRNYWATSKTKSGYVKTADGTFVASTSNPQHQTIEELIPIKPNSKILYQVWNPDKIVNSTNSNRIAWFDKDKNFISVNGIPFLTGDTYQKNYYIAPANAYFMKIGVIQGDSNNIKNENMQFKFEIGTKYTDWSPAPEDMATVTEMSNITQTVKDIQLTVADKVSQAQFTVLSNQVTTTVSDIADLINKFPDPDFKKQNPKPTVEGTGLTVSYDANGLVINNAGSTRQRVYWGATPVALTVGKTYNVKLYMNTGTAGGTVEIGSSGGENIKVTPQAGYLTWVQGTIKATTYTGFSIWVEAGKAVRLRELYIYEANTDITSSQITQLSDSINLRVEKNDVVNQINISTEGVLIAGKKIQITGETYIANAVIKTANIADLAITNAKIADATISSAKIINLDASKVTANNLAAITTDTGTLNVSGYLNILNQNTGMYGTYDYGDSLTGSYNPRWYTGSWRIGNNLFRHTAEIYSLTSSGGKGTRQGYFETSYGSDYVAMRKYNNSTSMTMSARIDINSDRLQVSDSWNETSGVILSANGEMSASEVRSRGAAYLQSTLDVAGAAYLRSNVDISGGLITRSTVDFQGSVLTRSRVDVQGSLWLTGDSYINSMPTYNRTTSAAANLMVTSNGYFARSTSARKYKADIEVASEVIAKAKKVMAIKPSSWFDKAEMARGEAQNRYFGFIADEFHQMDLKEVVLYGAEGQIESLAYDRISMYHNVILTEHEKEINRLKKQVSLLESQVRVLQAA